MNTYYPNPAQLRTTSGTINQPQAIEWNANLITDYYRQYIRLIGIGSPTLIKLWSDVINDYAYDTWYTIFESPNHTAKIEFKWSGNSSDGYYAYYYGTLNGNQVLNFTGLLGYRYTQYINMVYTGVIFFETENCLILLHDCGNNQGTIMNIASREYLTGVTVSQFLEDAIPIVYNWQPVSHLSGNDHQYYLDLAQIDASIIGDGETHVSSTDPSKFILSANADISRILANIPNDTETIAAYSGLNYMTVTRRYVVNQAPPNIIYYTLKFYLADGTLAYTTPELSVGDPPTSARWYLSFIIDDTHEVAMLDRIAYYNLTETYTCNDDTFPSDAGLAAMYIWLSENGEESETPYDTGSTDDGGDGGNPRPQDHIGDTDAPTLSGLNLGIVTLYQPSDTELLKISEFLWSDDVLDNFKKYFNNFADNIMALYILPFTPANLPTKIFKVGKMASEDVSLQAVKYCTQRYYDIDMGSVEITNRWGSYLDYSPYTKIEIYLPYCGIHSLDIDELMSPTKQNGTLPVEQGCTLSLKYRLDLLTGVIVAKVFVNNEVRYQFNGKVGSNTPLTGQTYTNLIGSIVTAGAGAAMTIASGGMTAPMGAGAAASVAGTVMAQKPNVESIGNISGDPSMLATKIPYVRISSPNKPLLENQERYTGFPSYKSGTVGSFSGYTEFVEAHVEGISCTEEERAEILSILKNGVII